MADHYILMTYYAKYLKEIRRVSDSTVKHYQGALKHISRYLVKKEKLKETVYEIQNIESLERIRDYLYADCKQPLSAASRAAFPGQSRPY